MTRIVPVAPEPGATRIVISPLWAASCPGAVRRGAA